MVIEWAGWNGRFGILQLVIDHQLTSIEQHAKSTFTQPSCNLCNSPGCFKKKTQSIPNTSCKSWVVFPGSENYFSLGPWRRHGLWTDLHRWQWVEYLGCGVKYLKYQWRRRHIGEKFQILPVDVSFNSIGDVALNIVGFPNRNALKAVQLEAKKIQKHKYLLK